MRFYGLSTDSLLYSQPLFSSSVHTFTFIVNTRQFQFRYLSKHNGKRKLTTTLSATLGINGKCDAVDTWIALVFEFVLSAHAPISPHHWQHIEHNRGCQIHANTSQLQTHHDWSKHNMHNNLNILPIWINCPCVHSFEVLHELPISIQTYPVSNAYH